MSRREEIKKAITEIDKTQNRKINTDEIKKLVY